MLKDPSLSSPFKSQSRGELLQLRECEIDFHFAHALCNLPENQYIQYCGIHVIPKRIYCNIALDMINFFFSKASATMKQIHGVEKSTMKGKKKKQQDKNTDTNKLSDLKN